MGFYLFIVSVVLIIEGVMLILAPKKVVKFSTDILKKKEPKTLAWIPLVVGVLLLFASGSSAVGWIVILLGLASVGKAAYLYTAAASKIRSHKWLSLSDNNYRAAGILILILGVIVFISRY